MKSLQYVLLKTPIHVVSVQFGVWRGYYLHTVCVEKITLFVGGNKPDER